MVEMLMLSAIVRVDVVTVPRSGPMDLGTSALLYVVVTQPPRGPVFAWLAVTAPGAPCVGGTPACGAAKAASKRSDAMTPIPSIRTMPAHNKNRQFRILATVLLRIVHTRYY